jgi:hypothetical protein
VPELTEGGRQALYYVGGWAVRATQKAMTGKRSKKSLHVAAMRACKRMKTTAATAVKAKLPVPHSMGDRGFTHISAEAFALFLRMETVVRGFSAAAVVRLLRSRYAHHVCEYVQNDATSKELFADAACGVGAGNIGTDYLAVFANLAERFVKSSSKRKMMALRAKLIQNKGGASVRTSLKAQCGQKRR